MRRIVAATGTAVLALMAPDMALAQVVERPVRLVLQITVGALVT